MGAPDAGRIRSGLARARVGSLVALGLYLALAFAYLGVRLLVEPGAVLGYGTDPKTFIWCFGWWPHALLHGENPFVSHALWAPSGVNLVWTASIPGFALLFSPLTLLVGPVHSYDVAGVMLPALAAWSAFLLCRRLTRAPWPSLLGGYLFGFSSYVLAQDEGHPHATAVFLVPLVALVLVRFLEGELGGRALALRLGPLFALELLISTEITFTLALALLAALALGWLVAPARRGRLVALVPPLLGGAAFAAALTAPFLYYAITGFERQALHPPTSYVTDVLNLLVPTKIALASLGWAPSIAKRFPGNNAERDAYLGLPELAIVALYAARGPRGPRRRFLLAALALAFLASLGARLTVDGRSSIPLPWALVGGLPLFDNVLPERLAMYVALLAAVVVALWTTAAARGAPRAALPALAVLALLPNPASGVWATRYPVPAFFTARAYRGCLRRGETVLALPVSARSDSMLWQAVSGYRFALAGGDIAPSPPPAFRSPRAIALVAGGSALRAPQAPALSFYLAREHVAAVVVDVADARRYTGALDRIAAPRRLGGVLLYRVSAAAPRCARA